MSGEKHTKVETKRSAVMPCDIVAKLCRNMTIKSKSLLSEAEPSTQTSVSLVALTLHSGADRLERIHLPKHRSDGWDRFVTQVTQSVTRYADCITEIEFVVDGVLPNGNYPVDLDVPDLTVPLEQGFSAETHYYKFSATFPPQQGSSALLTPYNMYAAIQHQDDQAVGTAIAAGVSVNSTWRSPMLTTALRTLSANYLDAPHAASAHAIAVFNLIASQPDVDWDIRGLDGSTVLQQTVDMNMCNVHHLLPWDKIDLDASNYRGDNILHSCCRFGGAGGIGLVARNRISAFVDILMLHGADGSALRRNNHGQRPSGIDGWPDLQNRLVQIEKKVERVISECLMYAIGVAALVHVIMDYY